MTDLSNTAADPIEGSSHQEGEQETVESQSVESTMSASDGKPITQSNAAIGVSTEGKPGGDDGSHKSVRVEDVQRIFTLFPKLPPELRVKVWRYALPGPRYIEVQMMKWNAIEEKWRYPVICKDKAPALFFVCHESRTEGLSKYALLPGTTGAPAIYYNSNKDILVFRYVNENMVFEFDNWLQQLPTGFVATIKHMAWECEESFSSQFAPSYYNFYSDNYFTVANINKLSGLETLQVCQHEEGRQGIAIGFREDGYMTQDKDFRDYVVDRPSHSGYEWAEAFDDIRPGWVPLQITFGHLILEEDVSGATTGA